MTEHEKILFEKLTKDRNENAKTLSKASMKGIWISVIEKYSDQAHFVYELIQNADDAGATKAKFELFDDKLVFIHNGSRHFKVTDVDTEEVDSKNGTLGDLNSIVSIANSNKEGEAKIGKFGVGFKAVFQYTSTPFIYDSNIAFKIENYIVPVLIENNFPGKSKSETAFVFPFNHSIRTADEAYNDIQEKLQNLVFPTLFLNNLQSISYKCGDLSGEYVKKVKETRHIADTTAELISFKVGSKTFDDKLWLFTRQTSEGFKYSCGFFIDKHNKLVKPITKYAFCFFPTKRDTKLNFIINAPFLLTDSREGIQAKNDHNTEMISKLAKLSADCLLYLRDFGLESGKRIIDDEILSFVPIDPDDFPLDNPDYISFYPFYHEIKKAFFSERIWPSAKGYVCREDAYFSIAAFLSDLISNEQLADLEDNKNAQWVFSSRGWEAITRKRDAEAAYLREIYQNANTIVSDEVLIRLFTPKFIKAQNKEWIYKLYGYIVERENRIEASKYAPILFDKRGRAVAAYDENDNAILFLDDGNSKGYNTVSQELLSNPVAKKLIERFEIKKPELKDKIFNKILAKKELDPLSDFIEFLKFYIMLKETDEDTEDFIDAIKEREFVCGSNLNKSVNGSYCPADLYYPTEDLKKYFDDSEDVLFVSLEDYYPHLNEPAKKFFEDFLRDLEVNVIPRILLEESSEKPKGFNDDWPSSMYTPCWKHYYLENDINVLARVEDNNDIDLSLVLWNQLLEIVEPKMHTHQKIYGVYIYSYHGAKRIYFDGNGVKRLKESAWIFDKNGEVYAPSNITLQNLDNRYDISSEKSKVLIKLLGIIDEHPEYENLDDDTKQKMVTIDALENAGLDCEQVLEHLDEIRRLIEKKETPTDIKITPTSNGSTNSTIDLDKPDSVEVSRVISDVVTDAKKKRRNGDIKEVSSDPQDEKDDEDELIKAPVDFSKKISEVKDKCAAELSKLELITELQETLDSCKKYSYGWFSTLLQLESLEDESGSLSSRQLSISFSKVEKELESQRTLLLKNPNQSIPQVVEELTNIPLTVFLDNGDTKNLIIEAANVQSYVLKVKVKADATFMSLDVSTITQATIVTKDPSFLIEELMTLFGSFATDEKFMFTNEYDMQSNLCENIKFVFGPPGTGKTTFLARETLIPIINKCKAAKVLVLAPTNKAADVLATRIMDTMGEDKSYEEWLVRFGTTADERIDGSKIYYTKQFNVNDRDKNVVITTMARFPYDFFITEDGTRQYLNGINWDYIVVDEASMIPLIQMVTVLYLKTPKQFIIAGDPFQIEPTIKQAGWKNENIYTMVNLQEFSDKANTVPYKYEIELLTTQYRSVPAIGKLFSNLTYKNVLKHARSAEDAKQLHIERYLDYSNVNIIKFPVSPYESIYRPQQLRKSNYQIYSGLFAYEFVLYLANALAKENQNCEFSVGIIAPYKTQADLVDKLLRNANIPKGISVTSGTIHGFQGDECDIVIALFNPPKSISMNTNMFLNKQNIINVAISRARDYIFVLVPDENTKNVENLKLLNRMQNIIKKDSFTEKASSDIEEKMFGQNNYLETNAFSTGHQNVNIYGIPEQRYEVRSEESALDVQVHGDSIFIPFLEDNANDALEKVIGQDVYHSAHGRGKIVGYENGMLVVHFEDTHSDSQFKYPKCFVGGLEFLDRNMLKLLRGY